MQRYRFGDFELDLDAFELRLSGKPVKIERLPLDLLALLVHRAGSLVAREEIVTKLWPRNVIIDFDSGLNTLVRKARFALGDSSESPRFIETVPGRGYRFIAPVLVASEANTVTAQKGDESLSAASPPSAPTPPAARASEPAPTPVPRARRFLAAAGVAFLFVSLIAIAATTLWRWRDAAPSYTRVAVLPFQNLTGNPELAYLAAGLAEDTSTSLAQIDPARLRVIGAAALERAQTAALGDVGRKLSVDFLVASSLRIEGTRIRVNSGLLRVTDGEQIWSVALDRELTDVLGIQRELSVAIAEQVRLRLSPEVAAAIDRRQTQSPEAYSLYLKGRYEWASLHPASARRALQYFEQATTVDPSYALAWAGLAFASITATRTADAAPSIAVPLARKALERALTLGPDLAETQYAQGYYSLFVDLDARGAERHARRALELDPNNSQAHMLLGVTLPLLDQDIEAREEMRRARELDPTFALAFANSANVALQAGDADSGLEFAKQTIAIDPESWLGHYYLGSALRALGDLDGALAAMADAGRLSAGHSLTYTARADLLSRLGRAEEIRALLAEMQARAAQQYLPPYAFAVAHTLLGEHDEAFSWLERAIPARDIGLLTITSDSRLAPLHDDPRFAELLRRCNCGADPSPGR